MKIGILGGGQLARMLALSGIPMGFSFVVLDPSDSPCASGVATHIQCDYLDTDCILEFAQSIDICTWEFENVPTSTIEAISKHCKVVPSLDSLQITQDRLSEKQHFNGIGISTPNFKAINSDEDLEAAITDIGLPFVLKKRQLGYDGKGQGVAKSEEDAKSLYNELGKSGLIAEEWVTFDREVSVLLTRDPSGACHFYDLTENVHQDGILIKSKNCPDDSMAEKAYELAKKLAESLDYVGTLALELFQVGDTLLANEFAPRVHNTGHWTIEGTQTSQFENHIRAVAGLPLGDTQSLGYSVMFNYLGALPYQKRSLSVGQAHYHDYGKKPAPKRKVGHITISGLELEKREAIFSGNLSDLG